MPNTDRVRNGGFEQSTAPNLAPFWTGTGTTENSIDGDQLLGSTNGDVDQLQFISQQLLPLEVGEVYEFSAAFNFDVDPPTSGTIDVDITGVSLKRFQAVNMQSSGYAFYSFQFKASVANATLTITNNSDAQMDIDLISIFKK
ncbi:hypothetical protein ACLHWY_25245 [Priestia aryabhattai]|uniref:hypothetical protein n=1 Tax=Priestia aryabhattai TaxID=412384 RepID=UPI00398380DE